MQARECTALARFETPTLAPACRFHWRMAAPWYRDPPGFTPGRKAPKKSGPNAPRGTFDFRFKSPFPIKNSRLETLRQPCALSTILFTVFQKSSSLPVVTSYDVTGCVDDVVFDPLWPDEARGEQRKNGANGRQERPRPPQELEKRLPDSPRTPPTPKIAKMMPK